MNEDAFIQMTGLIKDLVRVQEDHLFPNNYNIYLADHRTWSSILQSGSRNQPINNTNRSRPQSSQHQEGPSDRNQTCAEGSQPNRGINRHRYQPRIELNEDFAAIVERQSLNLGLTPEERENIVFLVLEKEFQNSEQASLNYTDLSNAERETLALSLLKKEAKRVALGSDNTNSQSSSDHVGSISNISSEVPEIAERQSSNLSPRNKTQAASTRGCSNPIRSNSKTKLATITETSEYMPERLRKRMQEIQEKKERDQQRKLEDLPNPLIQQGKYKVQYTRAQFQIHPSTRFRPLASMLPQLEKDLEIERLPRSRDRVYIDDLHKYVEDRKKVEDAEKLQQQKMEQEFSKAVKWGDLIYDTSIDLLVRSSDESNETINLNSPSDSNSIEELIARTLPDADVHTITQQAIIESRKLSDTIEALKNRLQIKVASDKRNVAISRELQVPVVHETTNHDWNPQPPTIQESVQHNTDENLCINRIENNLQNEGIDCVARTEKTIPSNIMDERNWGEVALPQPIHPHREVENSSSDNILTDSDMNFDDIFGADNVYHEVHPTIHSDRDAIATNDDSMTYIEKLDDPQFDDLPSDDSVQELPQPISQNQEIPQTIDQSSSNENIAYIEELDDPQFDSLPSDDSVRELQQPISPQQVVHQTVHPSSRDDTVTYIDELDDPQFDDLPLDESVLESSIQQTEQLANHQPDQQPNQQRINNEEDIRRLDHLLAFEELTPEFINDNIERGVLDLLLRQSDSLWDPIVRTIPINHLIPSRNRERGLLDSSITENGLDQPLLHNENDKDLIVHGLPQFSYEPVPQYLYRKKIHNIMDSEDEPEDSDGVLADDEMNITDLVENVSAPTFEHNSDAKIIDALNSKSNFYRELIDQRVPKEQLKDPIPRTQVNQNAQKFKAPTTTSKMQHEIKLAFHKNRQLFLALFDIDKNETYDNYVLPQEIETILDETPAFDSSVIRYIDNCLYHLDTMRSNYKKVQKYLLQPTPIESSSRTDHDLVEILKRFNKVSDGIICARLQSCPRDKLRASGNTKAQTATAPPVNYVQIVMPKSLPQDRQRYTAPVSARESRKETGNETPFNWMGPQISGPNIYKPALKGYRPTARTGCRQTPPTDNIPKVTRGPLSDKKTNNPSPRNKDNQHSQLSPQNHVRIRKSVSFADVLPSYKRNGSSNGQSRNACCPNERLPNARAGQTGSAAATNRTSSSAQGRQPSSVLRTRSSAEGRLEIGASATNPIRGYTINEVRAMLNQSKLARTRNSGSKNGK